MSFKSPRLFLMFAVLLAAALVFVVSRGKSPASTDAESAAYAEIVALYQSKNMQGTRDKCDLFMRNYPDSSRIEPVAALAGETLVQSGEWQEAGVCFRDLEKRFPKSQNLDRYVFYQALAFFQQGNFKESFLLFEQLLRTCPNSPLVENALYYKAMSNFFSNKHKETIASCKEYLAKYPDGHHAGDMIYRLAFIDFNDKGDESTPADQQAADKKKMADKIASELAAFLTKHPDNAANGAMYCLMADTYRRMNQNDAAITAYQEAVKTDSLDDVIQYALDSATELMQVKKDWEGIAKMHGDFITRKPESQLAMLSTIWVKRALTFAGKSAEASEILATYLKNRIGDPTGEQVEAHIDELVKTLVPRKKAKDIDIDAIDKQLVDHLNKITADKQNATTAARIDYARAHLAQMLKRTDLSDRYLQGIAIANAKDPSALSPTLLALCGDFLVKVGDLDGAQAMFRKLSERFPDSIVVDAAPVGLGDVALARHNPEEALGIFNGFLEKKPGDFRLKQAMLGKLQALVELNQLEFAIKLALGIVEDKAFRGETAGKVYLLLARAYRQQAAAQAGDKARELLQKAHFIYQRVYTAYVSTPEICAEAYWQAYETALKLGDEALAEQNLHALKEHPKLHYTPHHKKAMEMPE
jgi:TolA-binding protein